MLLEISFGMGKVYEVSFLRFIIAQLVWYICHYLQQRRFVSPIETIASRVWRRSYFTIGMLEVCWLSASGY